LARLIGLLSELASRLALAAVTAASSSAVAASRSTRSRSSFSRRSFSRFSSSSTRSFSFRSSSSSVLSSSAPLSSAASNSTAFLARLIGLPSSAASRLSLAACIAIWSSSVAASRSTRSRSSLASRSFSRISASNSARTFSACSISGTDASTARLARRSGAASKSGLVFSRASSMAFFSSASAASRSAFSLARRSCSLRSKSSFFRSSVVMTSTALGAPASACISSAALASAAAIVSTTTSVEGSLTERHGRYSRTCSNSSLLASLAPTLVANRPSILLMEALPSCSVRYTLSPVAVFSSTRNLSRVVLW